MAKQAINEADSGYCTLHSGLMERVNSNERRLTAAEAAILQIRDRLPWAATVVIALLSSAVVGLAVALFKG